MLRKMIVRHVEALKAQIIFQLGESFGARAVMPTLQKGQALAHSQSPCNSTHCKNCQLPHASLNQKTTESKFLIELGMSGIILLMNGFHGFITGINRLIHAAGRGGAWGRQPRAPQPFISRVMVLIKQVMA